MSGLRIENYNYPDGVVVENKGQTDTIRKGEGVLFAVPAGEPLQLEIRQVNSIGTILNQFSKLPTDQQHKVLDSMQSIMANQAPRN